MDRLFAIKPLGHMLELNHAPLNAPYPAAQWGTTNVDVSANRIENRWDHYVYRRMAEGDTIYHVPIYRKSDGTNQVLVLTGTDLIKIETGTGHTWSYLTPKYVTGAVSNITTAVVTGVGTSWLSSGIGVGDKFILDTDLVADEEPQADWATVASIDSDTKITLSANYGGTIGAFAPAKNYRVRLLYDLPSGERWTYAVVNGKFCFGNGSIDAQMWDGTAATAVDLNDTYAKQVRYMVAYDDRLWTADQLVTGTRNPWAIRWSMIGDPTTWDDTTSGYKAFLDTEEPITGMGIVGGLLHVYKKTMYHIGRKTGKSTAPVVFPQDRRGQGLYAPYSLVHALGTNYFMGVDDFYRINGDVCESIGVPVRKKFFEMATDTELSKVFGMVSLRFNQVAWVVTDTSSDQWVFIFNYKENSWSVYTFDSTVTGFGGFGF